MTDKRSEETFTDKVIGGMTEMLSTSANLAIALFQNYPDAIVIVNGLTGEVIMTNQQAEFMFGRSSTELQNMIVEDLMPVIRKENHKQHRKIYMENPTARPMGVKLDTVILNSAGKEIPVFISLAPILISEGVFVAVALRSKNTWAFAGER